MLNEKEFDILKIIEGSKENLSQRSIAKEAGYSIGTVNSTYALLEEKGFTRCGMGERIMRTETAATVAGSIILAMRGII